MCLAGSKESAGLFMFKILMKGKDMKIEKKTLNETLKVLGKVVSQTSPVEVQKSIRFVGDANGVTAMATDGIEVISLVIFCNELCKKTIPLFEIKKIRIIFFDIFVT